MPQGWQVYCEYYSFWPTKQQQQASEKKGVINFSFFLSSASLQHLIASITTPAELGESSTDKRKGITFVGLPQSESCVDLVSSLTNLDCMEGEKVISHGPLLLGTKKKAKIQYTITVPLFL